MTAAQMLVSMLALSLLSLAMVESKARPRPRPRPRPRARPIFIPFQAGSRTIVQPLVSGVHAVEDFVGGLFSPIFGGEKEKGPGDDFLGADSYGSPQYIDPPPPPPQYEGIAPSYDNIPCGEYGHLKRSFIGVVNPGEEGGYEDDCGVYEETNHGYDYHEHCEYIHETIFVTKFKTECSKTYSTQCQTSYQTECSYSHKQECRTEYQEECSYAESEECITVDRPTYNNVCTTEYVQECDGGGYEDIYEAPPACSQVPKEHCHQVAQSNIETECTTVPKRSCVTSPREVCGEVPKQDCKLIPTSTDCKDIPEKLCRQRAYQYPESTSRQVCGLGHSDDVVVEHHDDHGGFKKVKRAVPRI